MTYSEEDMQRPVSGGFTRAEILELPDHLMREVMMGRLSKAEYEQRHSMDTTPAPLSSQNPYVVTSWGEAEEDFTVPSGQRCRLRRLDEQMLLEAGILDKVARLPGIVQAGPVAKAQGQPPKDPMAGVMSNPEQLRELLGVMNKLVCLVVVKPLVIMEPPAEDAPSDGEPWVLVSNIGLNDRVAIMEHVMGDVKKLDSFRD